MRAERAERAESVVFICWEVAEPGPCVLNLSLPYCHYLPSSPTYPPGLLELARQQRANKTHHPHLPLNLFHGHSRKFAFALHHS